MNDLMEPLPENRQLATIPNEPPPEYALLQKAMDMGMKAGELSEFLALIREAKAERAKEAYTKAITAFKKNPPELYKTKKVTMESKDQSKTAPSFSHSELGIICDAIIESLGQHGLSHSWKIDQSVAGVVKVKCILTHEMGGSDDCEMMSVPDASGAKNAIQQVASTVTYLERYTLLAVCGLAPKGMDDDGAGADRSATITEEQGQQLAGMIKDKTDPTAFFMWATEAARTDIRKSGGNPDTFAVIERLGQIPAYLFQRCVDRLQKTRRAG